MLPIGCSILSPYLFNVFVVHMIRNTRLDDSNIGVKIDGRNTSNLRYSDENMLVAESGDVPVVTAVTLVSHKDTAD